MSWDFLFKIVLKTLGILHVRFCFDDPNLLQQHENILAVHKILYCSLISILFILFGQSNPKSVLTFPLCFLVLVQTCSHQVNTLNESQKNSIEIDWYFLSKSFFLNVSLEYTPISMASRGEQLSLKDLSRRV